MFLSKPFLEEPLFQVEQRLLVLGEDDQPLVVPQLAVGEQVLLDPADQGFGLGVGLLRARAASLSGSSMDLAVIAQGLQRPC